MYKKINVLIIEDENDIAEAISTNLLPILECLSLDGEFTFAEDEREVEILIQDEKYHLISLDGILRNRIHASPLIEKIIELNPEATIFSLSAGANPTEEAKDYGLTLCLTKDYDGFEHENQIISFSDLEKIKEAIAAKVKHQLPKRDLDSPMAVFSETYVDSTPSEKHAKDYAELVGKELIKNNIFFAALDQDFFVEIVVSWDDLLKVKEIAEKSDMDYWKSWMADYFKMP
jgi:hypothetical protein